MEIVCRTGFDDEDDGTICLQCGDKGFTNAFVYCVKCLGFAVHRYCLDVIPETFDEFVRWICDDCEAKAQNLEAFPSQTRDFISSNHTKEFSGIGTKTNNLLIVQAVEHACTDGSKQSYDDCTKVECAEKVSEDTFSQLGGHKDKAGERKRCPEDEKAEDNLMEHPKLSNGTPKERKKKKRKIQESKLEIDQRKLVNNECAEVECSEKGSDLTPIESGEKKDQADERKRHHKSSSQQPEDEKSKGDLMDHGKSSDGSPKRLKKKKRKIQELDMEKDKCKLVNDDCTKVQCCEKASEVTLTQSGGKKDKSDERERLQKSSSQQPEDEKAEDNLMDHAKSSEGRPKKIKKKKRKIEGLGVEKDKCKLVNDDCTKVQCCEKASEVTLTQSGEKKDKSDERERLQKSSSQQPEDEKAKDNLMDHAKPSDGSPKKTKKKKRLDMEKHQYKLVNDECTKVKCGEKESEVTLMQSGQKKDRADKIKRCDQETSPQLEDEKGEDNVIEHANLSDCSPNKKEKKRRKIRDSDTENTLAQSAGKKDKSDEKNRHHKSSSQQPEAELATDNLRDHLKLSDREKKKKKRKTIELDTEKQNCKLANQSSKQSFVERVKVDITELASDSCSPSKVKENEVNPNISSNGALECVKRKKRIMESPETIVKEQMHRSVSPQPPLENNSEYQCAEERKSDHIENGELVDGEKKASAPLHDKTDIGKDFSNDLHTSYAKPVIDVIWRGSFNILNEEWDILDGLVAHPSSEACEKVLNEARQLKLVIHLESVPKTDVWPKGFKASGPTGDHIGLYFFPTQISARDFDIIVEEMMHKDLALKAFVQNAELLIFHSTELPPEYWRFQDKNYLWGVFRGKQSTSHSHPFQEESQGNPVIHTNVKDDTAVSGVKVPPETKSCGAVSPCSPLLNSASCC